MGDIALLALRLIFPFESSTPSRHFVWSLRGRHIVAAKPRQSRRAEFSPPLSGRSREQIRDSRRIMFDLSREFAIWMPASIPGITSRGRGFLTDGVIDRDAHGAGIEAGFNGLPFVCH